MLGLVLCALVVSAALPMREFLAQRGRIDRLEQEQAARQVRVAALEDQRRLLDDPAYVAALARDRLHYVRPGETAYVVIGPDGNAEPTPLGGEQRPVGPDLPWYSQLWGSVREADRPAGR